MAGTKVSVKPSSAPCGSFRAEQQLIRPLSTSARYLNQPAGFQRSEDPDHTNLDGPTLREAAQTQLLFVRTWLREDNKSPDDRHIPAPPLSKQGTEDVCSLCFCCLYRKGMCGIRELPTPDLASTSGTERGRAAPTSKPLRRVRATKWMIASILLTGRGIRPKDQ